MQRQFDGKVAVVTGGGSGIGRAIALAFAREGARVGVADVAVQGGEGTVQEIRAMGGEALFIQTDVSNSADVERMVRTVVETYGRLDYAANNAGIEGTSAPTADCTEENWDRVIGTNLKGAWLCMKYEIPQILKQGGGAIVNIASIAGLVGFPGLPAYCASKGGLVQLTRTAALEYAKAGIRVNAVCPGPIRTPMLERYISTQPEMEAALGGPMGRIGSPEEIADAVLWLCSDSASFVNGHLLVVDGGWVAQ